MDFGLAKPLALSAPSSMLTQTVVATDGSEMTLPRQPFTLSRTPSKLMRRTPEFAEHTDELLAEFGFSGADIQGFRERGSVE